LITGGTGLIGHALVKHWQDVHTITVLTRQPELASKLSPQGVTFVSSLNQVDFDEIDAVINLAGEPIAEKRWSEAQKERICQSRWQLTEQIATALLNASPAPRLLLNASAVGFYGRQSSGPIHEDFSHYYPEFSHDVCARWENLAFRAKSEQTRVAVVRIGIVLAEHGGALKKMLPAFRMGLGGRLGDGRQYMSWIHLDDLVQLFDFLLVSDQTQGIYHGTAPMAVTNAQFSQLLAERLHRPCFFHMPTMVVRTLFGEMADILLYGQQVYPQRAIEAGFHFKYPQLRLALQALDL